MAVKKILVVLAIALVAYSPATVIGQNNGVKVGDIVTQAFFDGIIGQAPANCVGKKFYTRQAFLNALGMFPQFGTTGSSDDSKREIAAFFAHAAHETGSFCFIEEQTNPQPTHCDLTTPSFRQFPCNPSQKYFGRGPLQLTWNYNYGPAGNAIGFDGLGAPGTVANNVDIAFKSALWFWVNQGPHRDIASGFGTTIKDINSWECGGGSSDKMTDRITLYKNYCRQFGVDPGSNLSC